MMKINEIIDHIIKNGEESVQDYSSFYEKVMRLDFKKMLLSIIELEKEHIKRLKELKQEGNLESVFSQEEPLNLSPGDLNSSNKYSSNMTYLDFLNFIIRRDEIACKVYNYLMSRAKNQDVAFLFQRLAFDKKKQKAMVIDRYELEKINMGC